MSGLTWIHLSDWHHKKDFGIDPEVVRDGLLRDIRERSSCISPDLEKIDFIVFSGDAASGGQAGEYEDAKKEFFERILEAAGDVSPHRLFIVPGNHDLDEAKLKALPAEYLKDAPTKDKVDQWLKDDAKRLQLLQPFEDFKSFVSGYTGQNSPDYSNTKSWSINGKTVSLLGINSAWFCRRHLEAGKWNDYGLARVGERQIHGPLEDISKSDLRIAVLHHSKEWLEYYDGEDVWKRLKKSCHFILHGHGHELDVSAERGTKGDFVLIPAGAIFDRRIAKDPNRINSYNFVHLDFRSGKGTVFLRCWNDSDSTWTAYDLKSPKGMCLLDRLPGSFGLSRDSTKPSGPQQIRSPPDEFTGREREIEALLQGFQRGAHLARLGGMGGEGKTALALVLAEKLAGSYPDGQFFLDLQGTSNSPLKPEDAMAHVIRSFKGADCPLPKDMNGLSGLYQTVLSDKKVLILLDNAANREQLEPIFLSPGSALLVTSRIKFAVPGLSEDMDLDPGILPLEDAMKLLQKICGRIGDHAEKLAKLCGCLPIALRNAAYALKEKPNLNPEGYIERLGDAKKRLELVDASFSTSYDLLILELQRLWSMLSVFPADFNLAGAAAVWEMEEKLAEDALGELVKWSLVDFLPSAPGEGGRYKLHELARVFAGSHLEADASDNAQLRYAMYYLDLLRNSRDLYLQGGDSLAKGLALFDADWTNIREGQKWTMINTGKSAEIAEICSYFAGAGSLLGLRLRPIENIEWLEAALKAARQIGNRNAEGIHLGNLGNAYNALGDAKRAIECFKLRLTIAQEIGDKQGESNALGNLGSVYSALGNSLEALEYYHHALAIDREIGYMRGECATLGNIGIIYLDLGDTRIAIEYQEDALTIARKIGDRRGEGNFLGNLGIAYKNLGDMRKAIENYELQLEIATELNDRLGEGNASGNLGIAYKCLGDIGKAIEYGERHLSIALDIKDRRGEGNALGNLGNAYYCLNDFNKAIEYHKLALEIDREIENSQGEETDLGNLGQAFSGLGRFPEAIEHYDQALNIARRIGDKRGEANHLFNMSLTLIKLDQRTKAIDLAQSALAIFEEIESPHAEAVRQKLAEWSA